ncbi:MAG: PH domain-containing protein [Nocardioidaceae bacterium]
MDDLFAPPGHDWRPVSPALARLRHAVLVAVGVVAAAALGIATVAFALPLGVWLPLAVVLTVVLALGWVLVGRNARWWGYAEAPDELYIKHGALFRTLVVVPYGRMQYVDVQSGPLDQLYGIAGVHLHTASPGTSARIPGLPAAEAARLRDRLTSLGESQAAGL